MTERIVNHALEIIFLLTGEEYIIMKKNAPQSIHLLSGEVHIKTGDAAIYFSTEEWEYIERHKEIYKDLMMENLSSFGMPRSKHSGRTYSDISPSIEEKEESCIIRHLEDKIPGINENSGVDGIGQGKESEINKRDPSAVTYIEDKDKEKCVNTRLGKMNTDGLLNFELKGKLHTVRSPEVTMQVICVDTDSGGSSVLEESQNATCLSDEAVDEDSGEINSEVVLDVEQKETPCAIVCLEDDDEEVYENPVSGESWNRRMSEEYQTTVNLSHELKEYEASVFPGFKVETPRVNSAIWERGDIFTSVSYKCEEDNLASNDKFECNRSDNLREAIKQKKRESTKCSEQSIGKADCEYYTTLVGDTPFNCNNEDPYVTTHQITHNDDDDDTLYKCNEDDKHFPSVSFYNRQHIPSEEEAYTSLDFGKCLTDGQQNIADYMDSTGEKPFTCTECGQCFTRRSSLLRHSRFHTGEKPYACFVCGKCFSNKSHLVAHRRIHAGEKPYACPECGKCFANRSYLSVHKRTHTGEKPYSCPECGKRFTAMQSVVRHRRSHTGEKPYACNECGKRFTRRSCLNRHNRSHMRVKPFSCAECGECFTNKSLLDAHKITHTGEKLYSCTECGKCFTHMSALISHHRSHIEEKS
ncbi:hypothetical protein GDO86_015092 [Hymenochirus boettgeri]|uniref:C2H2-type domain-containing protein n=1 Tax=Hymenochirus boettgeri TaxID=247094 RepID=A0A8T2JZM4_9PIPI|nr:hypothetical protein GDO86_015092 [Hymenochirus boettgeri]